MPDQTTRFRDGQGYDHSHYDWNPLHRRTPLVWPDKARIAVSAYLYLEYMELNPPEDAVTDVRFAGALGSYYPDFQNYSRREFGNRVGIFRVLDILERYGLRATICANALAAARFPYLVERCQRAGHGFVAHGWSLNRMITSNMSEEEERQFIADCLGSLEDSLGQKPRGWAGQDYGESERTPQLLAQAGLDFVLDWPNDDEPYFMRTDPPLVSIPNQSEWDDAQLFAVRKVDSWRYPEIVGSAFEQLAAEGGQMLGLGIHPWIFGQAHRIRYLEEAVAAITNQSGVWFASAEEIADAFRAQRAAG
jgi:allantoinase